MSNIPNTQQRTVLPLSSATNPVTCTAQWHLEQQEDAKSPLLFVNNLSILVCGQEAFGQIAEDIANAEQSVDIVCWGFDPAMELTRSAGGWPRGIRWGDLLRDAATGKGKRQKKVRVRILCWFNWFGHGKVDNMPGYKSLADYEVQKYRYARDPMAGLYRSAMDPPPSLGVPDERALYNANWFRDVRAGKIEGLCLRTRDGKRSEALASLHAAALSKRSGVWGPPDLIEAYLLETWSTHHQKTIVIDYAGADPIAYVMGLNSVTDYWDTTEHKFEDARRGRHFEGHNEDHSVGHGWEPASSGAPSLKPYQDYACRIKGQAIAPVYKNFVEGWNSAKKDGAGSGEDIEEVVDLVHLPENLAQNVKPPWHRAQILRTMPAEKDRGERSIERLYFQASSFARNYIYIENQYFQHADWVVSLKTQRRAFIAECAACKPPLPLTEIPILHLIVVMPTPEHSEMVPSTHEALNELGHGDSMPNQDLLFNEQFRQHEQFVRDSETYEKNRQSWIKQNSRPGGPSPGIYPPSPPKNPTPLPEEAQAYLSRIEARQSKEAREKISDTLGIRALFASLWTYDESFSLTEIPIAGQIAEEAARYAHQQAVWNRDQVKRKRITDGWEKDDGTLGKPVRKPVAPPDRSKELKDAIARRYREIYIHSKLMIIDDSFFTLGSANLNLRSFTVDSEMNIASDSEDLAKNLRRRVWKMHAAGECGGEAALNEATTNSTFQIWRQQARDNFKGKRKAHPLSSFLLNFHDERATVIRIA